MTPLTIEVATTSNWMMRHVFVSTYGLVAEISLDRCGWTLHWVSKSAALTAHDFHAVHEHLVPIIYEMNVLRRITRRLKS